MGIMKLIPFPRGISLKVNVIAWLEFEHAYCIAVHKDERKKQERSNRKGKFLKIQLYSRNPIKGICSPSCKILRTVLKIYKKKTQTNEPKERKLMTMDKALYPSNDTHWLYGLRKEEGRGLDQHWGLRRNLKIQESPRGVTGKVLDFYHCFQTNILGKGMKPLILPGYEHHNCSSIRMAFAFNNPRRLICH